MGSNAHVISDADFTPPRRHYPMSKLVLILLSLFLPPLAVYLKTNSAKHTIINILLCILFYIPGVLHALYLVLK